MKKTILLSISIIFLAANAYAQESANYNTRYGIYAHFNLNAHSADFHKLPGVPNCCPLFETASGTGFTVGALTELPLSELFFLGLRAGYTTLDGKFNPKEETTIITNGVAGEGVFEHNLEASLGNLGMEVLLGIQPIQNLSIHLGLDRKSVV